MRIIRVHEYELEVPGFSSYLQQWGENFLVSVGQDADPQTGMVTGLQLSLFDVSGDTAVLVDTFRLSVSAWDTYSQAQYRKLTGHRGKKRALVAVANALLQAVWHMLTAHQPYRELGPDYLERLHHRQLERILVRRLEHLGHKVTLEPAIT